MLRWIQRVLARDRLVKLASLVLGAFNPFRPEHRSDPYGSWRALRSRTPVYRSRALGCWVLTRYDDVAHVLHNCNFTTDRNDVPLVKFISHFVRRDPEFDAMLGRNLLTLDGSEHARLRGLVSRAFTPRLVVGSRSAPRSVAGEWGGPQPSSERPTRSSTTSDPSWPSAAPIHRMTCSRP